MSPRPGEWPKGTVCADRAEVLRVFKGGGSPKPRTLYPVDVDDFLRATGGLRLTAHEAFLVQMEKARRLSPPGAAVPREPSFLDDLKATVRQPGFWSGVGLTVAFLAFCVGSGLILSAALVMLNH